MFVKLVYLVLCLSALTLSGDIGDRCTTPNGEVATCKPVFQCGPIRTAITNKAEGAADFAKQSHCGGVGASTLVCCGSVGVKTRLEKTPSCRTPNGELANCIPVSKCKIIKDAVRTANKDAIDFAKKSQCGYESEALVCCGSEAYPLRSNLLPNRTVCGEQKGDGRIHGGNVTQIFEFPWMVLLGYKNNDGTDVGFRCGGSIINSRYILTAAHCVSLSKYVEMYLDTVRLGEWNTATTSDCEPGLPLNCADPVIDLKIEEKIIHPQYSRRKSKNDIALLRLERNIPFTNYIQPICLPVRESPDPESGFNMQVAGWGATENSSKSDVKLKLEVPIVSRSVCNNKFRDVHNFGGVDASQLCAGGELGKDSCHGDSGGPLMRSASIENLDAKPKWFQEGIISWGSACAVLEYPGIYVRVANYIDWIIENLKSF